MRNKRVLYFLMCAIFFCTTNSAFSQIKKFYVWEKTYPCQDTRQDWFTVSQDYPGGIASTNSWQQADGPFDTFAEAMTAADGWKMSPRITKFKPRCCNDWNVYSKLIVLDGSTTTNFSVARASQPPPAVEGFQQIAVGLCCEEAFEKAFTAVGSISDCRNLQLSTGATVTVQPDGNTFLPFSGTSPGGGGSGTSLGCFRDMADFDLNGYLVQSRTANTVEGCVQTCKEKGFAYAGVQYGMSCLCGNSYGKYGPAANCDYKCTGNQSEICGGYAANSVYATGNEGGKGNVGGQSNCKTIKYNEKAQSYRGRDGEKINLCCPADSIAQGSIYGTDIYTDDSWICTAAIHAGLIYAGIGGPVTLQVLPGQASYTASTRHNVTSGSWSGYSGSFTFAGISKTPTTTTTTTTDNHEPPFVNQPDPKPPGPNPPSPADIDLSGSWHAQADNHTYSMDIKKISANEFEGTWIVKSFNPAGEDSYNVRVVTEGNGHGKLFLPFYTYEMTYTANQIVAGNTYTK